jgi:MFS family permease
VSSELSAPPLVERRRRRPYLVAVCYVALGLTAVLTVGRLLKGPFSSPYNLSAFWVTYSDGFTRRGLPGELLAEVTGRAPTAADAVLLSVVLMVAAAVALAFLVHTMSTTQWPDHLDRLYGTTLLVASPFTFAFLVRDAGRYDTIGYCALALVVPIALRWSAGPLRSGAALLAIAGLAAAATAAEEFLFAFLAPVCVVALIRMGWRGARLLVVAAATLGPAAVIAVASVFFRPSTTALRAAVLAAQQGGLDVSTAYPNAITALVQTPSQGLQKLLVTSPFTVVVSHAMFGGCFLVALWLLWLTLGRWQGRTYWTVVGFFALLALSLSVFGTDYKRWWALAFIAVVATVGLLRTSRSAAEPNTRGTPLRRPGVAAAACVVLACSLVGQNVPVWQWWDPASATQFVLDPPSPQPSR